MTSFLSLHVIVINYLSYYYSVIVGSSCIILKSISEAVKPSGERTSFLFALPHSSLTPVTQVESTGDKNVRQRTQVKLASLIKSPLAWQSLNSIIHVQKLLPWQGMRACDIHIRYKQIAPLHIKTMPLFVLPHYVTVDVIKSLYVHCIHEHELTR